MIPDLNDAGVTLYAVSAGAGTCLTDRLWMQPSPSQWLAGTRFLYSPTDTADFLGFDAEAMAEHRFVCRNAALDLALEAYRRACMEPSAVSGARTPVGLATTAAVASLSSPPCKGGLRIHVAVVTPWGAHHVKVSLAPAQGYADRRWDNSEADDAAAEVLAYALGKQVHWRWPELVELVSDDYLRSRVLRQPAFGPKGSRASSLGHHRSYPGSFNPIHDGHVWTANKAADACLSGTVVYAICLDSVHKQPPSVPDAVRRTAQIQVADPTRSVQLTTGDPLFVDKVARNRHLVIGADAMRDLFDPKWGWDPKKTIEKLYSMEADIIVVDRVVDGVCLTKTSILKDLLEQGKITRPHRYWANEVFRQVDGHAQEISSSAIRAGRKT